MPKSLPKPGEQQGLPPRWFSPVPTTRQQDGVGESHVSSGEASNWFWGAQAEREPLNAGLAWRWTCGEQGLATAQAIAARGSWNLLVIIFRLSQSISMKKCTHLTQPLYSRINLLTSVELLLLFPTDGAWTELHKGLGEEEGDHAWSNLKICHTVVAIFFWLTVLGEQQGYDLQSPRQQESLMTNPHLSNTVCETLSGFHLISGRHSLVIEFMSSSWFP